MNTGALALVQQGSVKDDVTGTRVTNSITITDREMYAGVHASMKVWTIENVSLGRRTPN